MRKYYRYNRNFSWQDENDHTYDLDDYCQTCDRPDTPDPYIDSVPDEGFDRIKPVIIRSENLKKMDSDWKKFNYVIGSIAACLIETKDRRPLSIF